MLNKGIQLTLLIGPVVPIPAPRVVMEALDSGRDNVLFSTVEGAVQSVAGFAALHVAITLLVASAVEFRGQGRERGRAEDVNLDQTGQGFHCFDQRQRAGGAAGEGDIRCRGADLDFKRRQGLAAGKRPCGRRAHRA